MDKEITEYYFDKNTDEFVCPICGKKLKFRSLLCMQKRTNFHKNYDIYDSVTSIFYCEDCEISVEISGHYNKRVIFDEM